MAGVGEDVLNPEEQHAGGSREGAAGGEVLVAVVESRGAKGVKDLLKARGWLAETHKPGARGATGCIAFPIVPSRAEELRAAMESSGPGGELSAISGLELVPAKEMAVKKQAPPQKAAARDGAKAGGRGAQKRPGGAGGGKPSPKPGQERSFGGGSRAQALRGLLPPAPQVRRVDCSGHGGDADWLWDNVFRHKEPAVLEGLDMGPCVGGWTAERLAAAPCRAAAVSVHVCPSPTVDLAGHRKPNTPRNFEFRNMPFSEAVVRCAGVSPGDEGGAPGATLLPRAAEPLLAPGERYYLRSVGLNPRAHAADMPTLFPELAPECWLLPGPRPAGNRGAGERFWLHRDTYHSSVLRLASDDTQLWTHFDVMDNVLAQVTGRKRVVMWPPSEDERLYVEGSSSRVADIDRFNDDEFPMFRASLPSRSECELQPGEALFIPALWFHNTTSIGFSVGVNVFWRSHGSQQQNQKIYDRKDLYGNRDPPAATNAIDLVHEAAAELRGLPQPFRDFYTRRALKALQQALLGEQAQGACINGALADVSPASDLPGRPGGPRVALRSGAMMPMLGLGTWELPREATGASVEAALRCGMRHIDCASIYGNQDQVGAALSQALASGAIERRDLFVTSKLWNSDHRRVREACLKSMRALQLDRLDLYLVHWPPNDDTALLEVWRQMEALVSEGLVTSIGVCNLSIRKLTVLLDSPQLQVAPAVNQVEAHPGWRNQAVLDFCASRGVHVTAYSPLGRGFQEHHLRGCAPSSPSPGPLLSSPDVVRAADALGCSPAQTLLRWALNRKSSAIFKSTSPEHIASNFQACAANSKDSHAQEPEQECDSFSITGSCWDALSQIPQQRRVKGSAFVMSEGTKTLKAGQVMFPTLEDLWDEL